MLFVVNILHDVLEREANYKKIAGKSCFNDKYESYYTLQDAKLACSSDPRCKAIYEDGCNDSEFFLCPESATFYDSWFSCIFEKERKGKFTMVIRFVVINIK